MTHATVRSDKATAPGFQGLGKRFAQDQRGAVLLIFALVLFMLAGFGALALDTAYLYARQNKLQTTADAGALAAASQLPDVAETTAVAFEFVAKSMPVASYGDVLVNADVVVGTWDARGADVRAGRRIAGRRQSGNPVGRRERQPGGCLFRPSLRPSQRRRERLLRRRNRQAVCLLALAPDGEGIRVDPTPTSLSMAARSRSTRTTRWRYRPTRTQPSPPIPCA